MAKIGVVVVLLLWGCNLVSFVWCSVWEDLAKGESAQVNGGSWLCGGELMVMSLLGCPWG